MNPMPNQHRDFQVYEKRRRRRNYYFDLIGIFFFFLFFFSYPFINFSIRVAVVGILLGFNGVTGDNGLEKIQK